MLPTIEWAVVRLYSILAPLRPRFDEFNSDMMTEIIGFTQPGPGDFFGIDRWCWQADMSMVVPFLFVSVTTMIGFFQLFAEPYVMTQGGPSNRTLSVVLLMFQEGFRFWNMGYAAAIAFVLFAILLVGTALQWKLRPLDGGSS